MVLRWEDYLHTEYTFEDERNLNVTECQEKISFISAILSNLVKYFGYQVEPKLLNTSY